MLISPHAGKLAASANLVNVARLVTAYYSEQPDAEILSQQVAFGTSGHRGSSFAKSFNEWHILAITQAICWYRVQQGINGPLFLGFDTHALSEPALASALEVLAANGVEVMLAAGDEYTPTPVISHAILIYNRGRSVGLADGIVMTPSHNPPQAGGIKYNPPHGGPAEAAVSHWIQAKANCMLKHKLAGLNRMTREQALSASTTHRYDFLDLYVNDLSKVLDMKAIQGAKLHIGVDPMGGAGLHYWPRIAEQYGLNITLLNDEVDATFRFIPVDWDGQIRMDPSSPYAMHHLITQKDRFDIAFACDTDHDRHGIVTKSAGLMPPNHYLAVAIYYLLQHRPKWSKQAAIGKTVVTSQMLDRVSKHLGRTIYEVPVGFKWFVAGLLSGALGFAGEESAGASFARLDGQVWTTDKDGMVPALLSAEIMARLGRDPAGIYRELTQRLGESFYRCIEAPATQQQQDQLRDLSPQALKVSELAGEPIMKVLTLAPGNGAEIGGLKVISENGWFVARPSGTEAIYKLYAESFLSAQHLQQILVAAQGIVDAVLIKPIDL